MKRIYARTLLQYSTSELWDMLTGVFILVFDDGVELETNYKSTLYSSYGWEFHRRYPETPLLSTHHVDTILKGNRLGSDTHLNLLGACVWAVYDKYIDKINSLDINDPNYITEVKFRDNLSKQVYEQTNAMYNDLTYRLEEYVVSLDITDFINVLNNPDIKAANNNVLPTQQSIDSTYATIKDTLFNNAELSKNPLSMAVRSKIVNINQVLQCVGPRGYLTDTDSNIFPQPILRGYAKGLRKFYDSFIESRSAAKSLLFSKTPLQQAEYFSRRLQLMSQIVQNLHYGDCGTTGYTLWKVRGPEVVNGVLKHSGDLKQLVGKHYIDTDGKLKTITSNSHDLIGKTLKLRTVIHCAHPDPYGICSTCFGELSLSVPENTNIGQMCCTSLAQKSSQNVLSIKHLDSSSVVEGITLTDFEKKYLKVAKDDNSYMLADALKGQHVELVINSDQATNITDIVDIHDVTALNITRVSELAEIGIRVKVGNSHHTEVIDVSLNGRLASMTYALLRHIRKHGWNVDDKGNYIIDMKDWDWSNEILTLPLKHFNMSDHAAAIASMLESTVDKLIERDKLISADSVLVDLFDLVNDKLTVNLAVLDVVLYSTMIISAEHGNYALPKPWSLNGLGVMKLSMANRSLSAAFAYEGHREIIVSPISYINVNRPDHPFDRLLY